MVDPSTASEFSGLSRRRLKGLGFRGMLVRIGSDTLTLPIVSIAALRSI
jgi:hypothetical protein